MIKRIIEDRIFECLVANKAILIFGARRVGKTILMKQILMKANSKVLFMNGEDLDTLSLLEPQSVSNYKRLLNGIEILAIDEAQNIPDIGQKLKLIVDEVSGIKVIASGSSSFDLLNKAGEPLVGRSSQFLLFPFSQNELTEKENVLQVHQNLEERIVYGYYPEVVLMNDLGQKKDYLKNIVNSYLLKDILVLDGLKNSKKMLELLKLIAFQIGSEVSYDELSRQLGLSRNTVEKYLDLLSKVFVIYKLGAFSRNLRKEVSKAGKWYFYDTGIRNAIISNFSLLSQRLDNGQLWENYLINERIKQNFYFNQDKSFYFWRTYDGQEIDLIEVENGKLNAFEFKWGEKLPRVPRAFADNYSEATYQVVNKSNFLDFILKAN